MGVLEQIKGHKVRAQKQQPLPRLLYMHRSASYQLRISEVRQDTNHFIHEIVLQPLQLLQGSLCLSWVSFRVGFHFRMQLRSKLLLLYSSYIGSLLHKHGRSTVHNG